MVEILFMLTTKSLVEEFDKLRAIFISLDDQTSSVRDESQTSSQNNESGANTTQIRPSSPLVTTELEELLQAVEVIFSSEFPLSNQYFNKPNILCRVLKNLLLKQHFVTSLTEFLKSASPSLLPLSFVHLCAKLLASVLRCVTQELSKGSDETKFISLAERGQLRGSLVLYMHQLGEEDLRNAKTRQSVEFCWERIQDISSDSIDTDCLDLALKYIKTSTLTVRLSGLAFINQQVSICERNKGGSNRNNCCNVSPSIQQNLANSKTTFKRWLKSHQMVSVLFGANTHVELVRQCHLIFQFMASGQLLTEQDVDVLWNAVNDKYKSREVISAIEGILHYLNETLLERFKKHLQELPLTSHSDQTFSLSCQITKVSWRRQLMTLNIAQQFGNVLAAEKRKRKHQVAPRNGNRTSNSQSSSSEFLTVKKSESFQDMSLSPNQNPESLALNNENQYPPNAIVSAMNSSPVLTTSRNPQNSKNSSFKPPCDWSEGNNNQSQTSDDSRTPLKSRRQRTSARGDSGGNRNSASSDDDDIGTGQSAGAPRQGVDVTGKDMLDTSSKRRKIDKKSAKQSQPYEPPPPPPPPLRLSRQFMPRSDDSSPDVNQQPGPSRLPNPPKPCEPQNLALGGGDAQLLSDDAESMMMQQEMNELFRGIQDSKTEVGQHELRRSVDSKAGPVSDNAESPLSATGRRNSEPDELQVGVNSPLAQLGEVDLDDEEDDDDDDLEDIDDETSALYCCDQILIRELLEQDGILKPVGVRPQQCNVAPAAPLTVDTSNDVPTMSELSSNVVPDSTAGQVSSDVQVARQRSEDEPNYDFEVISDQEDSNSTDSTASSSSSNTSLFGSSFFVKPGSSLIWDVLTMNRLNDLAPEQQECVKQNLFDLVAVFLKYPAVLKEMVRSLLNSIRTNSSTFMCVKMLQALFSNFLTLSNYAIQTYSMLDILVGTILSLVQADIQNFATSPNRAEASDNENMNAEGLTLSQSELGEFLHLFDAIFHKASHCVTNTFSDEHVMTLWTILSANPNYKDFFLNWLCGICQTDEIQIMTDQQWLMIYCKLVMTDSQWNKLQSDALLASTEADSSASESALTRPIELETYSSLMQGAGPVLVDLAEVHLLAVLFCKAVKGVFFPDQQTSPSDASVASSANQENQGVTASTSSQIEPSQDENPVSAGPELPPSAITELRSELINAGLQQFWAILLTSKDSEMQKMARDVLNGYYLHLPKLEKEEEFVASTFARVSKFLESDETFCLVKLKELQSIVCLLLHHIQQSYKKYSFHIRHSALKSGTAPIHSHSKTWMPRKGSHQLKLFLANRISGVNQPKLITMQSSDYLGELRAEVSYHQNELMKANNSSEEQQSAERNSPEGTRLKYYRILTNGLELKLEHDDRFLSDLCIRDESQLAAVLTFLHCDDTSEAQAAKLQLGDVFLKFPGCLYVEPPNENYPQVILLQETHFNRLFETLRRLSNLKTSATKAQIFNIDEIIRLVWDLIMLLPTYPAIQQQFAILSTDGTTQSLNNEASSEENYVRSESAIDWPTILDVDNVFKLLYSLQMLEHLAINCHSKTSQLTNDASLTPRGFGGHGANLLTPTLPNFDSTLTSDFNSEAQAQAAGCSKDGKKVGSDWCQKFVEYGGLNFLITVFESKILLQDLIESKDSCNVQWSEWRQECLASILRLFNIFAIHPYTSGGLVMRTQNSFCSDSMGSQSEMYIPPQIMESSSSRVSFVAMLNKDVFLDSLFILMNSASKTQTDAVSRRTLSLKSNLVCQCFLILNLYACHDPSICLSLMNHKLFSSLIYQLVVNFATKNISKTSTMGLTKLAQKSFAFCKRSIQQLIEFLAEVRSISESCFEDHNNRDSRDSSVIADPSSGQEYFALFENLMKIYLEKEEERANDGEFVAFLVTSIISALDEFLQNSYWSEEHGDCSSLRGLLTIMCSICRLKPPFVTSEHGLDLIKTLMTCLFTVEAETKTPKLVNPDSRKAAFDLIIQLASGCVKNYDYIYQLLIRQNSKEFHAPYPWSYWPLDERRSEAGFVGLVNLGATCYMATALQHLFMIHEARSAVLSANHNEVGASGQTDLSPVVSGNNANSNANMERKHGKVLSELQKMFAYLQMSDRKAYNPRSFCRSYVMDNEPLNTCDQKDMTEFFNDLIAKLEDMTPELRDLVHNLFRGEITNSVVSLDCTHVSKTVEQFYTVRCQVADLRDLYESLDEFCQIDMLEGDNMYTCSSCHTKVRAEKRASFKKLPRILVINTMRYKFNMESMAREKVNTHFLFPNHINMGKYTETFLVGDNSGQRGGGGSNSAASATVDSSQLEELNYELIGVTVHTGAAESGHYYCFVRDRSYPQSDVWFLFNDSEVKPFNPDNIPQECFGGQMVSKTFNQLTEKFVDYAFEKSHSAYMLFYERSVDLMRSEDKASLIQSNLSPSEIFSSSINTDNLQLRHDRLLFDKNYFEFLYKFNDVVAKTLPTPGDPKSANHFEFQRAKLSTTFVMETLVHSRENPSINFWLDFVTSLYSECLDVCKWLIKHLSQNDWWLNQVLIRCPIAHIRGLVQKLIFLAISNISNKTSEDEWQLYCKGDLRSFLRTLINFTNSSLLRRRHLRHFFEYCSLLMDVAKMGKRESLLVISVGTIGLMIRFFLDVKLQKAQPVVSIGPATASVAAAASCGGVNPSTASVPLISDDEDENGMSENDVMEFDALNELLSFTADGKKKSAVFHNIVELLELLLDKSCSTTGSSGGSSSQPSGSGGRDFQDLTRCLNETDIGALTSNNYEFLKILIEEEINLDSVSSILQMLIRMDKNFENFIPVRLCELILAAGSPDLVKPYFRILAKLESQLQGVANCGGVTHHLVKYIPKLLQWCPRATIGLIKDCARSPHIVNWALNNLELWVKQFLIVENNYRVRFEAAEILMMLIPDSGHMYNYWKSYVDKFNLPDSTRSFDHDERVTVVLHKILRHLLGLLSEFVSLSMGTYRFQYYFTVLTALTVSTVEKRMFTPHFSHLWDVFYPHLIHSKVENCVNKQALLFYWHWICIDCPQNVEVIVNNKVVLKNIFFNYILVNHEERDLITFNKQCLHSFFGLLRICCALSANFTFTFMQHDNFLWALENVFPYYNLYSKASNELLKTVEILLNYASDENAELRMSSPSDSQLSLAERREVVAFKKKLIFQFTKCLTKRGLWLTVPRIFSLLLQTENDIRFFIRETQGLRILTDALFSAFEASQHVSIFHTGSASTVAGGNAQTPVTVRGEIVGLLTKVLNTYRTAEDEVTEVSAPTSSQSTRTGTSSEGHRSSSSGLPQWKNISVTCDKLLSLLNPSQATEHRQASLSCLKEILLLFPDEAVPVLVDLLFTAHSSCQRKKCTTMAPGAFFPRSSPNSSSSPGGLLTGAAANGNKASGSGTSGTSGTVVGFNPTSRRFELAMCVHSEHLSTQIGVDKVYDEQVRQFYTPYYNLVQLIFSTAITKAILPPKLVDLICMLGLNSLLLRMEWFAKLLLEAFSSHRHLCSLLCGSAQLVLVFDDLLGHQKSLLNISTVFSFCTSYMPKAIEFATEEKLQHLSNVTSFFLAQSFHEKLIAMSQRKTCGECSSDAAMAEEEKSVPNDDPEELIMKILECLKALQLLFTCMTCPKLPDELSLTDLKTQLKLLHEEGERLKGTIAGKDPAVISSSGSVISSSSVMTTSATSLPSDSCTLPLKKMKLSTTTSGCQSTENTICPAELSDCEIQPIKCTTEQKTPPVTSSVSSVTSLNSSNEESAAPSTLRTDLTPRSNSTSGLESVLKSKSPPQCNVSKTAVLNLIKNLNSTKTYLEQFEERCAQK